MEVSATSSSGSVSAMTSESKGMLGSEEFFKLLIAQLQNQDPLQPMEEREFIVQMAQFQTLETMTQMNDKMSQLEDKMDAVLGGLEVMQQDNLWSRAIALIGRTVATEEGSGVIEKVKMIDGQPRLISGTQTWRLDEIKSVAEPSQPETEEGADHVDG